MRSSPRSRLFPYTTLFRSMKLNLGCGFDIRPGYLNVDFRDMRNIPPPSELNEFGGEAQFQIVDLSTFPWPFRSEEHTSELQSRENLVCRLLLEKKKTQTSL